MEAYNTATYNQSSPMMDLFWFAFFVAVIVGLYKTFEKAGQAGWKAIIPIYNIYVLLQIVKKPGWWLILYFIPFVNIVIHLIVSLHVAKAYGKSGLFGFFLIFLLSAVGYLMLGFGSAKYKLSKAK